MSKTAAQFSTGCSICLAVVWTLLVVCPWGWHKSHNALWTISTGLYMVDMEKGGGTALASWFMKSSDKKSKANQLLDVFTEGTFNMMEAKDLMCVTSAIFPEWCEVWNHMVYASWGMMFGAMMTIIFLLCAAGFNWYYWHKESTPTGRTWSRTFAILSPCTSTFSLLFYFCMTQDFGSALNFLGDDGWSFEISFFIAVICCLGSSIPYIVDSVYAGASVKEKIRDLKKQQDAEYGAVNAYCQNPGYGQQSPGYQQPWPGCAQAPGYAPGYGQAPGNAYGAAPPYGQTTPGYSGGQYAAPSY